MKKLFAFMAAPLMFCATSAWATSNCVPPTTALTAPAPSSGFAYVKILRKPLAGQEGRGGTIQIQVTIRHDQARLDNANPAERNVIGVQFCTLDGGIEVIRYMVKVYPGRGRWHETGLALPSSAGEIQIKSCPVSDGCFAGTWDGNAAAAEPGNPDLLTVRLQKERPPRLPVRRGKWY